MLTISEGPSNVIQFNDATIIFKNFGGMERRNPNKPSIVQEIGISASALAIMMKMEILFLIMILQISLKPLVLLLRKKKRPISLEIQLISFILRLM